MSNRRSKQKVVVLGERSLAVKANKQQPPKSSKAPRKRRNRQRPGRALMRSGQLPLKPCTLNYMKAVCDPFSFRLTGSEVCIPDLWDIPSYKFSTRVRGTFNTSNTIGNGGIVLSPFSFFSGSPVAVATLQSYGGTALPTPGDAGTFQVFDNSFPWTAASARNVRLVAAGLRVRYIGTQLNMGGQVFPIALCGETDRVCGLDTTEIASQNNTIQYLGNRAWQGCCFRPTHPDQMTYTTDVRSFQIGADADNGKMGVFVVSAAPGQFFEFEFVRFFEALSFSAAGVVNSVPSTTMSDSDISGLSTIRQFIGSVSNSEVGQSLWQKGTKFLAGMAANAASSYVGLPALTYGPSIVEL